MILAKKLSISLFAVGTAGGIGTGIYQSIKKNEDSKPDPNIPKDSNHDISSKKGPTPDLPETAKEGPKLPQQSNDNLGSPQLTVVEEKRREEDTSGNPSIKNEISSLGTGSLNNDAGASPVDKIESLDTSVVSKTPKDTDTADN